MGEFLVGRKSIWAHYKFSKRIFLELVRDGFPVLYKNGRVYCHTDNADAWLRKYTNTSAQRLSEDVLFAEEERDGD